MTVTSFVADVAPRIDDIIKKKKRLRRIRKFATKWYLYNFITL